MLTLKEARRIQKDRETRIMLKFIAFAAVVVVASFLIFYFTDITSVSTIFYLIPLAGLAIAVKSTDFAKLFAKKEFIGEVIKIDIYNVKDQRVKGERSYIMNYSFEAEIIIKNDKGKTMLRTFFNGDTTSQLCLGDRVAFMRLIDEPVVIKGIYLKVN